MCVCVYADTDRDSGYDETSGKNGEINSSLSLFLEQA